MTFVHKGYTSLQNLQWLCLDFPCLLLGKVMIKPEFFELSNDDYKKHVKCLLPALKREPKRGEVYRIN